MLEIDKSLEELKVYPGITPCPADFDDYWEPSCASFLRRGDEATAVADHQTTAAAVTILSPPRKNPGESGLVNSTSAVGEEMVAGGVEPATFRL
jgi:hypothetical protein